MEGYGRFDEARAAREARASAVPGTKLAKRAGRGAWRGTKKSASYVKNKVLFESRTMFGYLSLIIYALLAAGTGIALLFLWLPSFEIPSLDNSLRGDVASNETRALDVGDGTYKEWDPTVISLTSIDIALVIGTALLYVIGVRKQEKEARRCDKDPDYSKVKNGPKKMAQIFYALMLAMVGVGLILIITLFTKFMVILSIGKGEITEDARAFITWASVCVGINMSIKVLYIVYLVAAMLTVKATCMPNTSKKEGEMLVDSDEEGEMMEEEEGKAQFSSPFDPFGPVTRRD